MEIRKGQTVCEWISVTPDIPKPGSMVGLAIESLDDGIIHGLRHPVANNSNGWYIWCGEYNEDKDFFSPICIEHLQNYLGKNILEFLELPPGYRFLVDGINYEDVWFDENLLEID